MFFKVRTKSKSHWRVTAQSRILGERLYKEKIRHNGLLVIYERVDHTIGLLIRKDDEEKRERNVPSLTLSRLYLPMWIRACQGWLGQPLVVWDSLGHRNLLRSGLTLYRGSPRIPYCAKPVLSLQVTGLNVGSSLRVTENRMCLVFQRYSAG